jgi:hypothetical protein
MQDDLDVHDLIFPMLARFEELGLEDIAERLRALTHGPSGFRLLDRDADVVTAAEAADLLGLRSTHTVADLARAGHLQAFDRDGEIVLTRGSAQDFAASPHLDHHRDSESQLWSALDFLA